MSRSSRNVRNALGAVAVFLILLGTLYGLISVSGRDPVIEAVEPGVAAPGEEIVIRGAHFGDSRGRGNVRVAGSVPTSSAYREWSDTRIAMRVPEDVASGLVYVETERGRSNGVLFANAEQVPEGESGSDSAARPAIDSVSPEEASVGEVVTIRGSRFGGTRDGSRVSFTWESADGRTGRVHVPSENYGYPSWSSREIRVRVPDGAVSGSVVVETARGRSAEKPIRIEQPVGTKRFEEARTHAVATSVTLDSIHLTEDGAEGTVYLWTPEVDRGPEQRNHQILTESESPLFSPAHGVALYRIRNPEADDEWKMRRTVLFDRYAVHSEIDESRVSADYDRPEAFMRRYTGQESLLPVDAEPIQQRASQLGGRRGNPYARAERTYRWVMDYLDPVERESPIGAIEALESGSANGFGYATLATALLRAQAVPARTVAGYLVCPEERLYRHYWVEFYIEDFGWVPMDPAAADGAVCDSFPQPEEPVSYYFGGVDADRIAFSKGILEMPRMHPEGRVRRVSTMYSLQSHHEEVVGDIEWYETSWHDVAYLGSY
ncbi:MAG: transglutaminase domain-containing protein [Spirochaetaceae bacterium]